MGLVRGELAKVRSTQVGWWLLAVGVGLTALFVFIQVNGARRVDLEENVHPIVTSAIGGFTYVPAYLLGVLAMTTEYRYKTITTTVLITPSRSVVLAAKLVSYALIGAVYSAVCTATELAILVPWFIARGANLSLVEQRGATIASGFAVLALFALVGVGVGALLKNQVAAVAIGLTFLLVVDRLLAVIPGVKAAYPYTPDGAVTAVVASTDRAGRASAGVGSVTPVAGLMILLAWALVTTALAAATTARRDIT